MGFVRRRDLKLSIILRDLVVAALRPFCQCITERIISGSFVHDRRKVAVRRSIISDEAFRRRRRRAVGLAVIRPAAVRRCYRYRTLADRQLAVVDRYRNLRVVLSPNNIEAVFRQFHRILAGIGSFCFRFCIIFQAYRDACRKIARRKAAHALLGPIIYFRSAVPCNRDVGFVRRCDLKLSICLPDVVVAAVGAFRQRVLERVGCFSLIPDLIEVAVRRAIVSDKAFVLSGFRCCDLFTVRFPVIRPAAVRRCYRYRPLADRQLAVLCTYLELLGDILSVAICHLQSSTDTVGLITDICRTRITRLISCNFVCPTLQIKHILHYSGCRM